MSSRSCSFSIRAGVDLGAGKASNQGAEVGTLSAVVLMSAILRAGGSAKSVQVLLMSRVDRVPKRWAVKMSRELVPISGARVGPG